MATREPTFCIFYFYICSNAEIGWHSLLRMVVRMSTTRVATRAAGPPQPRGPRRLLNAFEDMHINMSKIYFDLIEVPFGNSYFKSHTKYILLALAQCDEWRRNANFLCSAESVGFYIVDVPLRKSNQMKMTKLDMWIV